MLIKNTEKPKKLKPIGNEYATPENGLPYVPDLHVGGTVLKGTSLTFWLSNSLFETGYEKIDWGKNERN